MFQTNPGKHLNEKSLKLAISLFSCVVLASLIILFAFFQYRDTLADGVHGIVKIYLEEISKREAVHLENNLDTQFADLKTITNLLENEKGKSIAELQKELSKMQECYSLQFLALVDEFAYYCSPQEYNSAETKISSLNKLLIENKPFVSLNEVISGENVILFSLPIEPLPFGDKQFVAAVAGIRIDDFVKKTVLEGSNTQARTSIIDSNGMFIVCNNPDYNTQMGFNLFSILEQHAPTEDSSTLQQLTLDISQKKEGITFYDLNGLQTLMYYTPVANTDWYVISEIPYNIISTTLQSFMKLTIIAGTLFELIVCCLLTFFLLSLNQVHTEKIRAELMQKELEKTDFAKKQIEDSLLRMAYYDELTGIANKNLFLKTSYELLEKSRQYAYVILDIRKFKIINDLFGFPKGDMLLKHMATVLNSSITSNEICARFSSDEFHLLLKYVDKPILENRLRRIITGICRFSFSDDSDYNISVCTGVYVLENKSVSVEKMGDFAKLALQKIKDFHNSIIYFYNEEIRSGVIAEQEVENNMQRGIDKGEFKLYLQPKYTAKTQLIAGAEALARWQHPVRGLLSPILFIPIFEKNGFILKLDYYMLEEVCKLQHKRITQGDTVFPISINQSRLLLYSDGYIQQLLGILKQYNIPHNLIELEITESVFLEDTQHMVEIVDELHKLGFSVSMDDFGSGYSTLNMLKEIMVDELKIDKDFFCESTHTQRGRTIVSSIISMARALNIQVVAEGVETFEQAEFLKEAGCNLLQGYYYSKPITVEELESNLLK